MVDQVPFLIRQIRFRDCIGPCCDNFSERFISIGRLRNQRHIICTRIMIIAVQAVRIGKMRVHASDFLRPLVHQIGKSADASADILGHSVGNIVGRSQHNPVGSVPELHLLTRLYAQMRASLFQVIDDIRKCNLIIKITVFHKKQCGHDLRNTSRILLFFCIFAVKKCVAVHVEHGR